MRKIILIILVISGLNAGWFDFEAIEKAYNAYRNGNYLESKTALQDIAESPQKHYHMANALYKAKKYDQAIDEYRKAKGVDEAKLEHNIGNSYLQKKEIDKAIESYEKSLKIRDDKDTKFNLEVAKKLKKQEEKKKKQEQKDKDKKQDEKQDKKDGDKDKKSKEQEKKKKDEEKKDEKGDKDSAQSKEQKQKAKKEKLKEQELKRLMKKLQQDKIPTMIYQMGENKKVQRSEDAKPW